jgi:hypothetical protein
MAIQLTGNPVKDVLLRQAERYENDARHAEVRHELLLKEAAEAKEEAGNGHRLAAMFREAASAV